MQPENAIVANIVTVRTADGPVRVPQVKLIDFGLVRPLEADEAEAIIASRKAGTACYAAPETMAAGLVYDGRVDAFSVACVVFALVACGLPNGDQRTAYPERFAGMPGLMRDVRTGEIMREKVLALETHFAAGTPARAWLEGATHADPNRRLTLDELIAHPWLADARTVLPPTFAAAGTPFDVAGMEAALANAPRVAAVRALHGGSFPVEPVTEATVARLLEMHRRAMAAAPPRPFGALPTHAK